MENPGENSSQQPEPDAEFAATHNIRLEYVKSLRGLMDEMQAELMVTKSPDKIARGFVAMLVTLHAIHAQAKDPSLIVQLNTTLMTAYLEHPSLLPILSKLIELVHKQPDERK